MRVLWLVLLGLLWAMPSWAFLSDQNVHPMPASPPSLPAAGSTAIDPTFGTTIMRVTDSGDSSSDCTNSYSNQPALNVNNSKIRAICTVGVSPRFKVWDFNAASLTRSNGRIQTNIPPGLQEYGAQWSRTTSNKFYAVGLKALYEVTIPDGSSTTYTNTLIRDFSANFTGTLITQMSMSDNGDVFAFHYVNGGVSTGYIAYKRSTNTILLNVSNEGAINEVEIDKSGRYLVAVKNSGDTDVWDLQAGPTEIQIAPTLSINHRGMGNGIAAGACNTRRLCVRNLATPNSVTFTLPADSWSYSTQQDHFSMTGTDAWMTASRYHKNAGAVSNAFDNEIVQIATDGSNQVRRIAHHHAVVVNQDYAALPKASVSPDGSFITFTSNWGNPSGRRDLYLARVQSIDATAPTAPSNIRVQ
jgi:hypothetical protein